MGDVISGGCRCKQLRYEAKGAPIFSAICHCKGCQSRTGGSTGFMFFLRSKSEFTGDFGGYRDPETSTPIHMIFCKNCGSTIGARPGSYPEVQILLAAALDDVNCFEARFHMWVSEKLPWIGIDDTLPRFAEHPEWEALGGIPDFGAVDPMKT